ncbi:MAG: putative Ig domain-containing protein [Chloroherpetonaceae bacterium]|nr:putative Ig domain-containing protein [Chloroherpetonaceae bacterium]
MRRILYPSHPTVRLCLFLVLVLFASSKTAAQYTPYSADALASFNKLERVGDPIFARDGIAAICVEGDVLYLAANTAGLYTYDIKNRLEPLQLGFSKEISLPTAGMVKKDNYLYLSDNTNGIDVFNVADPTQIKLVGSFQTLSKESYDLCTDDEKNYLFVATGKGGIEVWSLRNPAKPERIAETSQLLPWNYAWGVSYNKGKLFVSDREGGLRILDATNPSSLRLLSNYPSAKTLRYAIANDTLVFLANAANGFEVLSISNINLPKRIFSYNFRTYVGGLAYYTLNPRFFFVGAGRGGITVYDLKKMFSDSDEADNPVEKADRGIGEIGRMVVADHAIYAATDKNGLLVYNFNLTPLLTNVKNLSADEDQLLTYTFEGNDPDGSPVRISLLPAAGKMPDSCFYNTETRTLTWRPTYDQSGVYDFKVRITELSRDSLYSELPLRITVNHVNRAPSLPELQAQLTLEDRELKYQLPEAKDPDKEDAGKLTYFADNLPRGASFDPATRTLTWRPDFTQAGDYSVKFTVQDANTDKRGAKTDSKELKIRVDNVNLAPKFTRMEKQIFTEDTDGNFVVEAIDPDKEDESKLTYTASALPKGATFDPPTRTFKWKPDYTQAGEYTVRFKVEDQGLDAKLMPSNKRLSDTMTVFITVKQKNRPPVVAAIPSKQVRENAQLTFTVSASDPDKEDEGKLTFSADSLPRGANFDPKTRTFAWKPDNTQSGTYRVIFRATDTGIDGTPLSGEAVATITVENTNRPPKLDPIADAKGSENAELKFDITAQDPDVEDEGKLKVTAENLPEGAKFDGKTFTWTPNFEQSGTYKISYTVTDVEGLTDKKTQTITIQNTNRAPKFVAAQPIKAIERQNISFKVSAEDLDKEDKGKLVFSAENLPAGAKFDRTTQTFSWQPDYGQRGSYAVLFRVRDSFGGEDTMSVAMTIERLNRKPVLQQPKDVVAKLGTPLEIQFVATDEDKEDKLTFTATGLPQGATLSPEGKLTFTPDDAQSGTYNVQVTVKDDLDGADTKSFVLRVPYRPKFVRQNAIQAKERDKISFRISASDNDREDTRLSYTAAGLPQGAQFSNQQFTWQPDYGQRGSYEVKFSVKDSFGAEDTMSVSLTIERLNRKPKLEKPKDATVKIGETLDLQLVATDEDKEDKLTFTATGLPQGATLSPEGKLTFKASEETIGRFTVQITVKDDAGGEDTKSFNITVPKPSKK